MTNPYDNPYPTDWHPCEEDGVDGGHMSPGVGCNAPNWAGPNDDISGTFRRRAKCFRCQGVAELPARMIRGTVTCDCGYLRLHATCLSGMQYSGNEGMSLPYLPHEEAV